HTRSTRDWSSDVCSSDLMLAQIPISRETAIPPSCHNAPTETGCTIFSPGGIEPNMKTPTVQNWSLAVERGLTQNLMLSVGYVGIDRKSTRLNSSHEWIAY